MTTPNSLLMLNVFSKGYGISGNKSHITGKVYHKNKIGLYMDVYAACDPHFTRLVTSLRDIPYVKKSSVARSRLYTPCKKCFKAELPQNVKKQTSSKHKLSIQWATGWSSNTLNNFLRQKMGVVGFKCVSSYTGQLELGSIYTKKGSGLPAPCSNRAVHIAYYPQMAKSFAVTYPATLYLAIMRPSFDKLTVATHGSPSWVDDHKYYGQAYEIIGIIKNETRQTTRKQIFKALGIKDTNV